MIARQSGANAGLLALTKFFVRYGSDHPTLSTPIIANLMAADLYGRLGRDDLALSASDVVIDQINAGISPDGPALSMPDIEYVRAILAWILGGLPRTQKVNAALAKLFEDIASDIDVDQVRPILKRIFQMDGDDRKKLENFIRTNSNGSYRSAR